MPVLTPADVILLQSLLDLCEGLQEQARCHVEQHGTTEHIQNQKKIEILTNSC